MLSRRPWGARASLIGVVTFVVTVVALHLVQPEYELTDRLMSELALGPYGGAMAVAFSGLAIAVFGIQAAIGAFGASQGFRWLLRVAALFFLLAGVFPLGKATILHIAFISIAFVLVVLGMYLFPSYAGRASAEAPRKVSWSLAAGIAISIALGDVVLPMGIAQRLAAGFLLVWLSILGWRLGRAEELKNPKAI